MISTQLFCTVEFIDQIKITNMHTGDNVDNVWGLIEITDLHRLLISNLCPVWDTTEISSEISKTHMTLYGNFFSEK